MRLAWATDIHLNFIGDDAVRAFCDRIAADEPDAVLISGDIAEAPTVGSYMEMMAGHLKRPIYFVLGNHDFYKGEIDTVRREMADLTKRNEHLHWLPVCGVVKLTEETALVGHDGWGDGRLGNGIKSPVLLNDFALIRDLAPLWIDQRMKKLAELGDEAGAFVRDTLPAALDKFKRVVFVTHVPPFKESCWHAGEISNDDWLPFFTCKAVGDALVECMEGRNDRELHVLCGHTHGSGEAEILPNLRVSTGGAEYTKPQPQAVVVVS